MWILLHYVLIVSESLVLFVVLGRGRCWIEGLGRPFWKAYTRPEFDSAPLSYWIGGVLWKSLGSFVFPSPTYWMNNLPDHNLPKSGQIRDGTVGGHDILGHRLDGTTQPAASEFTFKTSRLQSRDRKVTVHLRDKDRGTRVNWSCLLAHSFWHHQSRSPGLIL